MVITGGIAESELIKAVEEAIGPGSTEGFTTVTEMAQKFKVSKDTIRKVLIGLNEERKLEVQNVLRTNVAGRTSSIPGYKLKETR